MSLKFRLAFLYSLSVFIILLISALSIFLFNENFRRAEFNKRLISECKESGDLFFSAAVRRETAVDQLNQLVANSTHQTSVYIFDSSSKVLYAPPNAAPPSVSPELFNHARQRQIYSFTAGQSEYVMSHGSRSGHSFYVLTSGYDIYGRRKSDNLKVLLVASVLGGLLLSAFLAYFYVTHTMQPLEELKTQIEKIDEKNLKERIPVNNKNNEVWQIAKKFNAMLDRLEQAFDQRKNFVRHASHELRTPLANMLSQTESALGKSLSAQEYREVLVSLKEDQQDLVDLTNSLLTLSKYDKVTSGVDWTTFRIDELLYEVVDFAKQMWPAAKVTVEYETLPENETELEFQGNESLIRSALHNLVKNAIHYSSDAEVKVGILADPTGITLHFDNTGEQLSGEEQNKLFIPFFRGENAASKKGFGLGLSIVQRIVYVHKGSVRYDALGNHINRFTLHLPARA